MSIFDQCILRHDQSDRNMRIFKQNAINNILMDKKLKLEINLVTVLKSYLSKIET